MMCDVNDRHIRINLQDHAFQRADQMVVRSVVRRQGNDLVSQWSLSAWAFCDSPRIVTQKSHIFTLKDECERVKNAARGCCAIANAFHRCRFLVAADVSAKLERAMGIEPTSEAWEASILPLYDARSVVIVPANRLAGKYYSEAHRFGPVVTECLAGYSTTSTSRIIFP